MQKFAEWRADVLPKEYVPRQEYTEHEDNQQARIKAIEANQTWLVRYFIGATLTTIFGLVLAIAKVRNG